jgi:hypothetical protein
MGKPTELLRLCSLLIGRICPDIVSRENLPSVLLTETRTPSDVVYYFRGWETRFAFA